MKKKVDFYFVDKINFHKRNFNNFITHVEENFTTEYNTAYPKLKMGFGKYEYHKISGLPNFKKYEELFKDLDHYPLSDLKNIQYKGYQLWDVVYAELYAYLTPKLYQLYLEGELKQLDEDLFDTLTKSSFEDETLKHIVFYNFAIGAFWIDYWATTLKKFTINNLCVFGGTTIFSRAATLIAQWNNVNVLSFEGSFIKEFHYADNGSGMITNNHRFADHSQWVKLQGLAFTQVQEEWLGDIMENRLNLNVVQPNKLSKSDFYTKYGIESQKKVALLIGQVVNDFSVTRDLHTFDSTIDFYVNVIKSMQNNPEYHLFIKLHPWENHKQNSTTELSKRILESKLKDLPYKNYTIDYDVNIDSLIDYSDIGITSCSQAGLEMLYTGKRVVQVGNAFYGSKGWTIDVSRPEFLDQAIKSAVQDPVLSAEELKEVKKFMYHLLKNHCFLRVGKDDNFYKKFTKVTEFGKNANSTFSGKLKRKLSRTKKKLSRVNSLLKKSLKEPKKAYLALKYKISLHLSIYQAKMTSKKVINMVMGQATYSKIFEDMLDRFKKELKDDYLVIVTAKPLQKADVYHYWRPNASKDSIVSPSIVTVHHDFDRDSESLSLRHFIDSYKKADMILCLNEQQKNRIHEYIGYSKPMRVIPHGYDIRFQPKETYKTNINEEEKLVIGFSSRRYPRLIKGEETLYKIIDGLKDQPVKFLFIGQDRKKEFEFCQELGVEAEVHEKISYSEFPALYKQMDLFLITSKAEGGPASLPEALATGLPVVSTPCGFVPDMIINGENGFISDYEDSDGIIRHINKYIQNPVLLKQMGEKSLQTKNLKTWEKIIRDYATAYEDISNVMLKDGQHEIHRRKGIS
ncbi:glycosyltransferase [Metabacillus indicus]|uniref:glycosyltransferase n=1 Tax=Metabacillus indicus TaxID=246786 RepID=UPI000A479DBC|nr:glycosyltransferase [Metabacillus indicus]